MYRIKIIDFDTNVETLTTISFDNYSDALEYVNDHNHFCLNSKFEIVESVFPDCDDYFDDFGTDLQFGKHDLEVMNGEGYYDEDGFYHAYAKEC